MNEPTRPPRVTSAARSRAFHLLDEAVSTGERRLFAVVDGAACLLDHGGHVESARLLLEVAAPDVANAALAVLVGKDTT